MKVLVAAASKHGSTNEIAEAIGAALREADVEADVQSLGDANNVADYDAVVLGSAVYVGKWLDPAKDFVDRYANELRRRPVWLFSSGPLGEPPKPVEEPVDAAPLAERIGARGHRVFSGELAREKLGFGERATTRLVRAPYGDFRDWTAIRAWANDIATTLKEGSPSRS